jgi:hypothetical protein
MSNPSILRLSLCGQGTADRFIDFDLKATRTYLAGRGNDLTTKGCSRARGHGPGFRFCRGSNREQKDQR